MGHRTACYRFFAVFLAGALTAAFLVVGAGAFATDFTALAGALAALAAGFAGTLTAAFLAAGAGGAALVGAVLTGAVLTGAVLTGAVLTGAVLTGAVLTGAVFLTAGLAPRPLTGAAGVASITAEATGSTTGAGATAAGATA
ncbi:pentapeptide repeat-containing protein, partial [Gemmatimonas sp.]|uniref:pentapeptide repeat-containing protein n=1 Tax=Gemmatimonas sp. TaxID=1962908 RepID=UPI003566892C